MKKKFISFRLCRKSSITKISIRCSCFQPVPDPILHTSWIQILLNYSDPTLHTSWIQILLNYSDPTLYTSWTQILLNYLTIGIWTLSFRFEYNGLDVSKCPSSV